MRELVEALLAGNTMKESGETFVGDMRVHVFVSLKFAACGKSSPQMPGLHTPNSTPYTLSLHYTLK